VIEAYVPKKGEKVTKEPENLIGQVSGKVVVLSGADVG
jgi:hypothetical protein